MGNIWSETILTVGIDEFLEAVYNNIKCVISVESMPDLYTGGAQYNVPKDMQELNIQRERKEKKNVGRFF